MRRVRKIFFAIVLLLLLAPMAVRGQSCATGAAERAAAEVRKLQTSLRTAPVNAESPDTDVPVALRPVLHRFKLALVETVELALRCGRPAPNELERGLAALLRARIASTKPPETQGHFGDDLTVSAAPVPRQAGLVAIELGYRIPCGDDTILLLYQLGSDGWRRELLWMNPDLNSIGDAFGDFFDFTAVPAPVPAVAVVHGTPWCTSNLSVLHADLLALGTDRSAQKTLDHRDLEYRRDADTRLRAEGDGFEIRAEVSSLGTDLILRPGIYRFSTTAGRLERRQPLAGNARDFVDAWLEAPWAESAAWTADRSLALHAFRDRFDYDLHKDGGSASLEYGPVLACGGGGRFQVELDLSDGEKLDRQSKAFAHVRAGANAFTLLDVTPEADGSCTGPDLMKRAPHGKRKTTP